MTPKKTAAKSPETKKPTIAKVPKPTKPTATPVGAAKVLRSGNTRYTPANLSKAAEMRAAGKTVREIAEALKIPLGTAGGFIRYLGLGKHRAAAPKAVAPKPA